MRPLGYARARREQWAAELEESEDRRSIRLSRENRFLVRNTIFSDLVRALNGQLTKFDFPNEEIQ